MEDDKHQHPEEVVEISLNFAKPFHAGIPLHQEQLVLRKDGVEYSLTKGRASRANPARVFSYPIEGPFAGEEDVLKDYASDFLLISEKVLAYPVRSELRFHPRMSDVAYPSIVLTFADGSSYELLDLPLSLSGNSEIEAIVALMKKYRPEGLN